MFCKLRKIYWKIFWSIKNYFFFRKINKTDFENLCKSTLFFEENPRSSFDFDEYLDFTDVSYDEDCKNGI